MDQADPNHPPVYLPRGEVIVYPTGRVNIRVLTQRIRALGYTVWTIHIDIPGFQQQQLPRWELLHAVVVSRVILLIATPEEPLSTSISSPDSALDRSSGSTSEAAIDSDNVDSETGQWERRRD